MANALGVLIAAASFAASQSRSRPLRPHVVAIANALHSAALPARDGLVAAIGGDLATGRCIDLFGATELCGVQVLIDGEPMLVRAVEPDRVEFVLTRRGGLLVVRTSRGEIRSAVVRMLDAWPAIQLVGEATERTMNMVPLAAWHVGNRPGTPVSMAPIPVGPPDRPTRIVVHGSGWRHAAAGVGVRLNGVPCRVVAAYPSLFGFAGVDELVFELPQEIAGRGPVDLQVFVGERVSNLARIVIGDAIE